MTNTDLLPLGRRDLRDLLRRGRPVDPRALEGWAFQGTTLGVPGWVERLSWKTFQKVFWRDERTGRLLGWNVRLEQDGVGAPSRPRTKAGRPDCRWFFEVLPSRGLGGLDTAMVDYARGPNPALDPLRWVKDPLVALSAGDDDLLLGVSWVVLGSSCVETPTFFSLRREHPVGHVPEEIACA